MTHHLRTTCPFCGVPHDRITNPEEDDIFPENGDATMCFACGAVSILDDDTDDGLRKPTRKERREIEDDTRVREMRRAWQAVKRQ